MTRHLISRYLLCVAGAVVSVFVFSLGIHSAYASPAQTPLKRELRNYLATRSGHTSVAVYDTSNGSNTRFYYRTDSSAVEYTASIVKVNILMAVMARAQTAHEQLSDSLKELATRMIENSDNDAATDLWNSVGGAAGVTAFNRADGIMTHTTVGPGGYWGLTTTNAIDQAEMMHRLTAGDRILTRASRAYIFYLMNHVTSSEDWGVNYGVSSRASVALKDGWLPVHDIGNNWQINSIGYVGSRGRSYTIAVLSGGDPGEGYGIQTVEHVSALVWKYS